MRHSFSVLLASFCLLAAPAWAGDKPLYAPAPAWVKPAPAIGTTKLTDADPIMLLLDQQQRLSDGQVWIYGHMAMRMASPQVMMQSGTLPLEWDPSHGDLIVHGVEIVRGNERIDALAGGKRFEVIQRETKLERATLSGTLTATLAIEGLRLGDVLHVRFSITRKDAALGGHVQAAMGLAAEPMPLKFGRARMIWPRTTDLRWRAHMGPANLAPVDIADGYRELSMQLPLPKPAEMPGDAPMRYQPLPLLEATDYADWADVSRSMERLYQTAGTIAPGTPLAGEIARIAAASSDRRVRAATALQLVQDKVRYLFRGMDDGNYVPQTPAQSWSLRYGDCKAKSLLLLAVLRELGIEAEAVLVSATASDFVPTRLPMPGAFDHVIVRAVIDGETYWLDGTGAGARLADLSDVPPFRHALPLRAGGADLLAMTARPNARPITDAEIEFDSTAGLLLPTPFKARITVRGASAEQLRMVVAQGGKDALNDSVDGVLNAYVANGEIAERSFKYDEATATGLITASGLRYADWKKEDGRYKIALDPTIEGMTFAPDRARPAWRDIPVSSGAHADTRSRIRMRLPAGGEFAVEGNRTLPPILAGVVLQRNVALEGGVLTVEDRTVTGVGEVAPADIAATRAQVAQVKARMLKAVAPADYPSLLDQIKTAKRSKTLDPILAVYTRKIAEDPQKAGGYTSRAWFLERVYDRAGAIGDLTRAIALEPTATLYQRRAGLYSDMSDDAKALADARSALELDPGSPGSITYVAALLGRTGKRDEAISMVSERIDAGGSDKPAYQRALADLLGDSGRVDEAVAILDGAIAESPGQPVMLNSRCWLKGTRNFALESALRDCTKAIQLADNPASILDSRAMVYFRLNRFDEALEDLNAALEEAPELGASLFLRGVIRKRSGAAGADADLAAARIIAPRVDEVYSDYGIKP